MAPTLPSILRGAGQGWSQLSSGSVKVNSVVVDCGGVVVMVVVVIVMMIQHTLLTPHVGWQSLLPSCGVHLGIWLCGLTQSGVSSALS